MFQRLRTLLRGFVSLFITGLEQANPKALIEAERENLRKQIARFNDSLSSHAGFCERLMRQIKAQEAQERELAAKAAAHLKAGNREMAGQYALQLKTLKEQLEENRGQLQDAEKTYQNLLKAREVSVREASEKIEKLKRLISETEMLEAQAELQEMASSMIGSIGGSGDTLNRVEEYLNERRDKAAGRARVAKGSLDMTEVSIKDEEQKALADQALAEFASAYGMEMPAATGQAAPAASEAAAPATPAKAKEMGPSSGS